MRTTNFTAQVFISIQLVVTLVLSSGCMTVSAVDTDVRELIGVWGDTKHFSPATPIRVDLESRGDQIIAFSQGHQAAVKRQGDAVNFQFPGTTGSYRGHISSDPANGSNKVIRGHWISAPGVTLYNAVAIPMTLAPVGNGQWRGAAEPFEQVFSIYVTIFEDEDNNVTALLRNPERNQGLRLRITKVTRAGNQVEFHNADGDTVLSGRLNEEPETLSISLPWRGGTYDLTRRARDNAPGFYPRPSDGNYHYRQPAQKTDGWKTATPDEVGFDTAMLEKLVQSIVNTETTSVVTPYIHNLLIARNGKLVLDEYFYGHHAERAHDLRSATKSLTGLMIGKAIAEEQSLTTESSVYAIMQPQKKLNDARRSSLKVKHLLSMSSGYACDDNDDDSPGNEMNMQDRNDNPDWYDFTLKLPMLRDPGASGVYCSAGINLLGGIVSASTNTWLPEFFRSRFAEPLNIKRYYYNLDPLGRGYAGGGIHMRPRDFLKFAQLMINNGRWQGSQVVSAEWVKRSAAAHAGINEANNYGYTWWRKQYAHQGDVVEAVYASGNGGQFIIAVPSLELAIGLNGGNYMNYGTWSKWRDELVPNQILTAIKESN